MNKLRVFLLTSLLALLVAFSPAPLARADAPPPLPNQPHPDIFSCGVSNCQIYNPTNQEAKATHAIQYRLIVMPGCTKGLIEEDLGKLQIEFSIQVKFALQRNDAASDFTIRVNCGLGQSGICGSVNIWCLGRGFPGIADIDASDIMYSPVLYPEITRLSILIHELMHALGTWNEQYCLDNDTAPICRGLGQFGSAPGWIDFMNTGPNARHLFGTVELGRWERTMYLIATCSSLGYDECTGRWRFADKWSWDPITGIWYDALGRQIFGPCNQDRLRLDLLDVKDGYRWRIPLENLGYYTELGQFVIVPAC